MRLIALIVLLLPGQGAFAEDLRATGPPYIGRSVAAVIDAFSAAGEPFAYSTNLVTARMIVRQEPVSGDPVTVVTDILRPYGLTVRRDSGVYLIVRSEPERATAGAVRLVVGAADGNPAPPGATVTVSPQLTRAGVAKAGVFEFAGVPPGRYEFKIAAVGYSDVRRVVDVESGQHAVLRVSLEQAPPRIETISVTASRYEILREVAGSRFVLDQRAIQSMPDIGEDPVRIAQRLPGAAASGASARVHLRGGETDETGIMLNGVRLFDPFHVRDYQSIFSAIDARAIDGVEVYTGGFPAQFGNRMSGMVLMESLDAIESGHSEIGLSVYNASLLNTGREGNWRWLLSARRGNLDLVINPEFGSPSYYDVFAEVDWLASPTTTLSFNALYAEDSVEIVLESDPAELERVVSNTRNAQAWLRLENHWSEQLVSDTVVSAVAFDNLRRGTLGDTEAIVANVVDDRRVTQFGLRQDFVFSGADRHQLRWGLEVRYGDARYDYRHDAEYFGFQALFDGRDRPARRRLSATPNGAAYAAYFSDRWQFADGATIEWGLRWDDQTYTGQASDAQLSPRLSLLRQLGPTTDLRLSWGRYFQAQEINELQIEDGIVDFWPAQRADHFIVGLQHRFDNGLGVRVEAFHKDIGNVRPRFENLFNPLGLIPEVQTDRVRLDPARAAASGVEISLDHRHGAFSWWASYVLSEVTDSIDSRDVPRSWDQRHALQGGASWRSSSWELALAGSVHTGWPLTELSLVEQNASGGDTGLAAIPDMRNAGRYPTFASLDLRVSRRWSLPRGTLQAFLEVSNLTGRRNQCCLDFDLQENALTGDRQLERGLDYWMGALPAVGLLWEF